MRVYALFMLLMYASALNFEASLMSHTLAEVDALDTSQLNCQTPRSHFEDLEQNLTQWQQMLENKDRIPSHIETLTQMKHLIKHKKYEQLVEKIKDLDLISPPVLSELQSKLQGLQSHDKHERDECTETLTKLCAYLIKQMNNVHQQCQQSPVTVIKVKGKIEDLKIIQSGCQQSCQPTCPDEPVPEIPTDLASEPSEEPTEEQVEEGVPPTAPEEKPTPDEDQPTPEEDQPATPEEGQPKPDEPEKPQDEEGPTDEPPVNPNTEESPEEATITQDDTEEWTIPGQETEEQEPPSRPISPSEENEEPTNEIGEPDGEDVPELVPEESVPEASPENPSEIIPGENEEQFGDEETAVPPTQPTPSEEHTEEFYNEETPARPPRSSTFFEEEEEQFGFEEASEPPTQPTSSDFPEEIAEENAEESYVQERPSILSTTETVCHSSSSTDVIELTATQTTPGSTSTLTISGDYGFGLFFQKLQKYPAFTDEEEYHLASLQDSGNTVLAVVVTQTGVKCVTADGSTYQDTSVSNDDFEGDWTFVFITHGSGVTGCGVKFFNELTALRQITVSHPSFTSLDFVIGGQQDSLPSFQGKVYGHFAVSDSDLHFEDLTEYNEIVGSCNDAPEDDCTLFEEQLGDYNFDGFDDTSDWRFDFSTWNDGYAVSGWFKWVELEDQDVWHTVFRLSENLDADLDEIKLGDRDLALFLGNSLVGSRYQLSTYTYSGSGNPNLWDSVEYGSTLTKWHYIYFGYSRRLRYASYFMQLEDGNTHSNLIPDARHYLVPQRSLYLGNDLLYPAFNGQFSNWRFHTCIGDVDIDILTSPNDIEYGYNPKPYVIVDPPPPPPSEEHVPPPDEEVEEYLEDHPMFYRTPEDVISPGEEEFTPSESDAPEEFPEEEAIYAEEDEYIPPPPSEAPPAIPDEINPEPLPEPETQPEPEPVPEPQPKPTPGPAPAPPSEPQVPVVKECEATIDVTKENAADILCAISEYLAQLASGHVPELGINPSRVCFCLQYDDSESNESFMQVETILKENDAFTINKLVAQRRI